MDQFQKELEIAIKAAKTAGDYLLANQGKITIAEYKESVHNYTTQQDLDSQASILGIINKEFPNDKFLTEENTSTEDLGDRFWIIDPIDGTRNYANGLAYYAINIALFCEGEVKVGVTYAPGLNETLYSAIKGQRFSKNDRRLERTTEQYEKDATQVLLATSFPYDRSRSDMAGDRMKRLITDVADIVRLGSAALELAMVADGTLGLHIEENLKPWDVASGVLFLEEMGCACTDFNGKPIDIFRKNNGQYSVDILSGINAKVHETALRKL